ncbi:MAG TPA: hypothetical protein VGW38_26250 [Chloroflexota bacterium]|nr:hypothetical protein [Chloroflexota bacterium]
MWQSEEAAEGSEPGWTQPHRHMGIRIAALAVLAGVGLGCSKGAEATLPESPPTITVMMTEYEFLFARPVPAGRVVFWAENMGTVDHELILAPVPDEFPPIDEQVRGEEPRVLQPLYYLRGLPPGRRGSFAVDLSPGRYALICFLPDSEGVPHALKGMTSEFRVS